MCSQLCLSLFAGVFVGIAVAANPLPAASQAVLSPDKDKDKYLLVDPDPVIGTWILNLARSKYMPGPPPKSQTRTYEAQADGVKATIRTVYADGHSSSIQYSAKYDSVEYPVTGSPDSDMIALKRIDKYTAEAKLAHAGKEMASTRRVISADGKTMTIAYKGQWEGKNADNTAVFDKQEK